MRKLIEILFYTFPISFILGNAVITLQLVLFIILSLIFIKKNKLVFRFKESYWILITFFLYFFLTTVINYQTIESMQILLNQQPGLLNVEIKGRSLEDNPIFKSILLIRFPILIFVVDTLFFNKILNLKKFFLLSLFCTSFVSLDIILQYITGSDIFGYKSVGNRNSGPFGDELIAGGYLQRFSFFSIFILYFFKEKLKNPLLISIITIHAVAILFSGNRIPLLLFLFGCFLIILFIKNLRTVIAISMVGFILVFSFVFNNNVTIKNTYKSFIQNISKNFTDRVEDTQEEAVNKSISEKNGKKSDLINKKRFDPFFKYIKEPSFRGSGHPYIFNSAIIAWKDQPWLGFGLKSFRVKCWDNLTNGSMSLLRLKENISNTYAACSTHPHNYYLEFLSESGIIGISLLIIFFTILWKDFFYYFLKFNKRKNLNDYWLAPIILTIFIEIWPLRSTGSFFSTGTATFFWLTVAILLASKVKR